MTSIGYVRSLGLFFAICAAVHPVTVCADDKEASGLRCDAVIELYFPQIDSPIGLKGSGLVIFGQYTVFPGDVRFEVIWSEPMWFGSNIPWFLPSSAYRATDSELYVFRRESGLVSYPFDEYDKTFKWAYGAYDPSDLRGVVIRSRNRRIRLNETGKLELLDKSLTLDLKQPSDTRTSFDIKQRNRRLSSIENKYELIGSSKRKRLKLQRIHVPPRIIETDSNRPILDHPQGRKTTVKWADVSVDGETQRLPIEIRVDVPDVPWTYVKPRVVSQQRVDRTGRIMVRELKVMKPYTNYTDLGSRPLRRCRLSNYRSAISNQSLPDLPSTFVRYSEIEEKCMKLIVAQQSQSDKLPEAVEESCRELEDLLSQEFKRSTSSGHRFRYLHQLIKLTQFRRDRRAFKIWLTIYAEEFEKAELSEFLQHSFDQLQMSMLDTAPPEWRDDVITMAERLRQSDL